MLCFIDAKAVYDPEFKQSYIQRPLRHIQSDMTEQEIISAEASHACEVSDSSDAEDACYICLSNEGPLVHPCSCPRVVHAACLAKWQLNCAGKE